MFGIEHYPLFVLSGVLLNLTPGQDTFYVVGRSVAQGREAGVVSALGISTGTMVHTLLAALGLSAVLAASSLAFGVVKALGAGYLIWIGIGFLRDGGREARDASIGARAEARLKLFRQGLLTNLLNPKVALFFLSFLPQFVSPRADSAFPALLVLGLTFLTTGTLWCLILALGSAWIRDRMGRRSFAGGLLKRLAGLLFLGLGIRLALSHAR
jgi:RhtB (resistance to homoserine/threonine) family protein